MLSKPLPSPSPSSTSKIPSSTQLQQLKVYTFVFITYLPILLYTHTQLPSLSSNPSTSTTLAAGRQLAFYSTILFAISVIGRCLTPPNPPPSLDKKEKPKTGSGNGDDPKQVKDSLSPFTTSIFLTISRGTILFVAFYHGILSLLLSPPSESTSELNNDYSRAVLDAICPHSARLNYESLFTFSPLSTALLTLTIGSALLRILAFKQLGRDFTFQLNRPSTLVTTGLYAWVRHPSYTFLVLVGAGIVGLFARSDGVVACWVQLDGRAAWWWGVATWGVLVGCVGSLGVRVWEEEELLEREFKGKGKGWEEWVRRTGRFVPWIF